MICLQAADFADWRAKARALIMAGVPPDQVMWESQDQELLFAQTPPDPDPRLGVPHVPKDFPERACRAACFRGVEKWGLLYRLLWRIQHENRRLLEFEADPDVRRLRLLEGEVRRDSHKMKAFVRFRQVGEEDYVAWHEPSHLVLERTAPFFARRFAAMRWAILTPDRCAYWDGQELKFGPGLPRSRAPAPDEMEELWKTYYRNIFNPARIKVQAMRSEMPLKFWKTMPETALISSMLAQAGQRVESMALSDCLAERPDLWTARLLASQAPLSEVSQAAAECRGCELCRRATQTVFGRGSVGARLMIVGEQPGDQEDLAGEPFVGPAGQLLREVLAEIGAEGVYLTNVVKHFHWEPGGKTGMRLHKRASRSQIEICKPWVQAEIQLVRPQVLVCLGNTAAQALLGRDFQVTRQRGQLVQFELAPLALATYHPSYLLRSRDTQLRQNFVKDLRLAWESTC